MCIILLINSSYFQQNKLIWLRAELRGRINRERKLRMEFQQALNATDSDRQFLVSEIVRRNEELDDLAFQKQGLLKIMARELSVHFFLFFVADTVSTELLISSHCCFKLLLVKLF